MIRMKKLVLISIICLLVLIGFFNCIETRAYYNKSDDKYEYQKMGFDLPPNQNYPFLFFFIGLLSLIPILLTIMLNIRVKKLSRVLENIAVKKGGKVTKGTWLSKKEWPYPILTFGYNNNKITIFSQSGQLRSRVYASPPHTYVKAEFPKSINSHILIRKKILSRKTLNNSHGSFKSDDEHFNEKYVVKSNDEYLVQKLVSSDIRNNLIQIYEFNPKITIKDYELTIQIPDIIFDENVYNQLIDTALKIADKLEQ